MHRTAGVAIVSLLGATMFWAGNYIVGAVAVEQIDPVSLVLLRWALALVPLIVIAQLIEKPDWRALLRSWPWLITASLLGLLGYNLLLYAALEHTSAFNASLINAFNPALIAIAAAFLLRERLHARAVVGILIALAGVLIVLTDGDVASIVRVGFGTGELLMIGAILVWSAYTMVGRMGPRLPPIAATSVQAAITIALLAPISLVMGGPTLPTTSGALWSLVFIAVFPSVLSYVLWNRALTVLPASGAGVFLNLITVFVALFTIVTGQPYTWAQLIGGLIVIGGVTLTNLPRIRRDARGEPGSHNRPASKGITENPKKSSG